MSNQAKKFTPRSTDTQEPQAIRPITHGNGADSTAGANEFGDNRPAGTADRARHRTSAHAPGTTWQVPGLYGSLQEPLGQCTIKHCEVESGDEVFSPYP